MSRVQACRAAIFERTDEHSSSEYSSRGSRFARIVPGNRTGSWARKVTRLRRACLSTVAMSMPSIKILPVLGGVVASSESASVLFPEPVRPMRAVVEPPLIVKDTLMSAGSRCGAYWMVTSSKIMSPPSLGQYAGGCSEPGGSSSRCRSSTTRSTDTKSI